MFHGTQYIDIQIMNAMHVFQMLPLMAQTVPKNSLASSFLQMVVNKKRLNLSLPGTHFMLLGKGYQRDIDEQTETKICALLHRPIFQIKFHKRAVIRGIVYHSKDYTRVRVRNSYTVKCIDGIGQVSFGFIEWFAEHKTLDQNQSELIACIRRLNGVARNFFNCHHKGLRPDAHIESNFMSITLPHLFPVSLVDQYDVVPIRSIIDLCLFVEHDVGSFVCVEPDHHETNL